MTGTPLDQIQKREWLHMTESVVKTTASWRIKLEPRLEEHRMVPCRGLFGRHRGGIDISGIIIASWEAIRFYRNAHIARASFGDVGVLSDTIVKATPIILAALACSIAFRMKLWNIGAEGQFIMGAFGASAIVLAPVLPAETSRWLFIPVMALAGMAAGAVWGFIPGYPRRSSTRMRSSALDVN